MSKFSKQISIRWSDIDPNFHLRHSAYYDFGSQHRIEVLAAFGLTLKVMQEQHFGPLIFREECIFRREIHLGDHIIITAKILKMRPDASRWSIQHEFINADKKLCAVLTLDGAWLDTERRKIATPTPLIAKDVMNAFPKTDDFVFI